MLAGARAFHVNVNCSDLDRSCAFYEALGLRAATRTAPDGPQPGDAFALDRAQWNAWILVGDAGFDGAAVDLLEWKEPSPTGSPPATFHTQGFQRVGVLVPDLDVAMGAVSAHGGQLWSEPTGHVDARSGTTTRLVQANDPDGVVIELVEAGGPAVSFVGVVCADVERSVAWYGSLGFRHVTRFASANDDSRHLRIDGPSSFEEAYMAAPDGGLALMLVGFDTPDVMRATPRPANALGIWRVALLVPDLDASCRGLDELGVDRISAPVEMSMGSGLPALRFVCFRGPDGEVIELIEQPV